MDSGTFWPCELHMSAPYEDCYQTIKIITHIEKELVTKPKTLRNPNKGCDETKPTVFGAAKQSKPICGHAFCHCGATYHDERRVGGGAGSSGHDESDCD